MIQSVCSVDKTGKSPGNLPHGSAQASQVLSTLPTLSQTVIVEQSLQGGSTQVLTFSGHLERYSCCFAQGSEYTTQVSDRAPAEGGYTLPEQPTVTTKVIFRFKLQALLPKLSPPLCAPQEHVTDFMVFLGIIFSQSVKERIISPNVLSGKS